jgi:cation transport ATPase
MAIEVTVDRLQKDGRNTMTVRHGTEWLGVVGLADQPRPEVRAVLAQLRTLSLHPLVMLTGDNHGVAEAVARAIGVDETRSDLPRPSRYWRVTCWTSARRDSARPLRWRKNSPTCGSASR